MIKYLILDTTAGGYKSVEMGATEFAQGNLTPIDTTERDALTIPAGAVPLIFNSDTSTFQMKLPGGAWYSLATTSYADALVVGLWDDRGAYDASVNAYPSSGGSGTAGAIKKGDIWTVSVAGTVVTLGVGDTVRALVDGAGAVHASWATAENNFGYTPENTINKATTFAVLNNTLFGTTLAVNNQITDRRNENGILANSVSDVGTAADLLEKDLKTYTLPGETLAVDGSYVEVYTTISFAANANAKSATLYFGGTLIGVIDALALNAKTATFKAKIMRSAAGAQVCVCEIVVADATASNTPTGSIKITALTKTMADAQIIKITGTNGVASASDVVCKQMIVKNNVLTA